MERTLYLIFFVVVFNLNVFSQTSYKQEIYEAYVENNMSEWKNIIDEMNLKSDKSKDFRLELLNYQYGYIAWCLGNDKDSQAGDYLEIALENFEFLENISYMPAILKAYKSAFWGFKIGLSFYKAPFLGPESLDFAELSVDLDKSNYFGYIQLGNIKFYR